MDAISIEKELKIRPNRLPEIFRSLDRLFHGTVLLETQIPGGNSILAWDPVATVSINSGRVETTSSPDVILPSLPSKPDQMTRFMQDVVKKYKLGNETPERLKIPFTGGFAGFAGYEWSAGQEKVQLQREAGVPEIWFGLYDRALVSSATGVTFLVALHSMRNASVYDIRRQLYGVISQGVYRKENSPKADLSFSYDFPKQKFEDAVKVIRNYIRNGDVYQVNIAQRINSRRVEPWHLYQNLKKVNPSPFSGILSTGSFTIVSNSPERLLKASPTPEGTVRISTRPIAGTRPRGAGIQDLRNERALRSSSKERAEHTMLVDLSRNDLGRISKSGSVEVDELMTVERYSHVMHLVSDVRGELSASAGITEIFLAMMPGGSVTGTPKISANRIISEVEPVTRGAYTGSLGYISLNGNMDFNILIRSAFYPGNSPSMHVYAGSGIVQDSVPAREWSETVNKARALLESIQNSVPTGYLWSPPSIRRSWKPPVSDRKFSLAKVLLIDNYDSFTYNLVQYLSVLGADITVIRNDSVLPEELKRLKPTHLVISPGPGKPEDSGISIPAIHAFHGIPTLGVCLGHQAIIEAYGGTLKNAHRPMHGKDYAVERIEFDGFNDIMDGIPSPFRVGRYHSLVAEDIPDSLAVTAMASHGEVMAVQHRALPTFGVQFHPESILTPHGLRILSNFLAVKYNGGKE